MLKDNVEKVLDDLKGGNNFGEKVTLVAATKTNDADVINLAIKYGVQVVAENRVQEFREKTDLIKGAEQQFIGRLQTNKVKYLVGKVTLIQSVDSVKLAEVISSEALKRGVCQNVLLEVNVGEESKGGFSFDEIKSAMKTISELKGLKIKGLMTMMPISDDSELLGRLFDQTRALYDSLKEEYSLDTLSMGMSGDYNIAIRHGSNMVRIGSAIFGKRNYGGK